MRRFSRLFLVVPRFLLNFIVGKPSNITLQHPELEFQLQMFQRTSPKLTWLVGNDSTFNTDSFWFMQFLHLHKSKTRWWFQISFIFTPIWGRFPFWLIFSRWVETTNQKKQFLRNIRVSWLHSWILEVLLEWSNDRWDFEENNPPHIPKDPCMVYLPTYIWLIYMVNVGKYTIQGWYGIDVRISSPTREIESICFEQMFCFKLEGICATLHFVFMNWFHIDRIKCPLPKL